MRVALYFTPAADASLTRRAAAWLGRDAFSGERFAPGDEGKLTAATISELTAAPRRYGFHATIKPPFRLAPETGLIDVKAAVAEFARSEPAWLLPRLRLERLGPFFALTPERPDPRLDAFAADVVRAFDRFRAPLTPDETAKRDPASLSPTEARNLQQWGYPHVMEAFRFHMTLTGPINRDCQVEVAKVLARRFDDVLADRLVFDALTIFLEPGSGADFRVESRHPLRGQAPA